MNLECSGFSEVSVQNFYWKPDLYMYYLKLLLSLGNGTSAEESMQDEGHELVPTNDSRTRKCW